MNPMDYLNTTSGMITACIFFIIGILGVQITHQRDTVKEQTQLFIVAYLARITMILIVYYGGLIEVLKDEDSSGWVAGYVLYNDWVQAGYSIFSLPQAIIKYAQSQLALNSSLHFGYTVILATEFFVLSMPGRMTAAVLGALVGSWIPVLAYRMSMQIFDNPKAARYVGWALTFMPSLIVFSSQTLKEPIVVFIEVLCLYCCVQISQFRYRLRHIVALSVGLLMVYYMRFYVAYVIIGTLILSLVIPLIFRSKFRNLFIAIGILISPLVFIVTYRSAISELNQIQAEQARKLLANYSKGFGASSNMQLSSNVENPFDITKTSQILPGLIFGLIHLMYAPFPWQIVKGSTRMILTTPEMLWWYYNGTLLLYRGLREARKINPIDMLIPFIFCVPLLFFYALIFNNIGLAYRYRAQIFPELILFISLGYHRVKVLKGMDSQVLTEEQFDDYSDQSIPKYPPLFGTNPARFGANYTNTATIGPLTWSNQANRFRMRD